MNASADGLAGALHLCPGPGSAQIHSSRQALAPLLARGKPALELPELLGRVFAFCGDSHRLTARQALGAAGMSLTEDSHAARALQIDTLREHLRRIWLDWPPALRGTPVDATELTVLRDCPALRRDADPQQALAAMPAWLAEQLLAQPAAAWLDDWERAPAACLARWCQHADTLPARLLRDCQLLASRQRIVVTALHLQAENASLIELAAQLQTDPDLVLRPLWRGQACETGPWTRLHQADSARFDNSWLRLGARLAEVVRLSLPDQTARSGAQWLRSGAVALGPGEGLAWCEMARGLLVHRVRLDAKQQIDSCDVLAPTEWNFHPQGVVAQALAALPADCAEAEVRLLAAAFDPCVKVQIERRLGNKKGPPDA